MCNDTIILKRSKIYHTAVEHAVSSKSSYTNSHCIHHPITWQASGGPQTPNHDLTTVLAWNDWSETHRRFSWPFPQDRPLIADSLGRMLILSRRGSQWLRRSWREIFFLPAFFLRKKTYVSSKRTVFLNSIVLAWELGSSCTHETFDAKKTRKKHYR